MSTGHRHCKLSFLPRCPARELHIPQGLFGCDDVQGVFQPRDETPMACHACGVCGVHQVGGHGQWPACGVNLWDEKSLSVERPWLGHRWFIKLGAHHGSLPDRGFSLVAFRRFFAVHKHTLGHILSACQVWNIESQQPTVNHHKLTLPRQETRMFNNNHWPATDQTLKKTLINPWSTTQASALNNDQPCTRCPQCSVHQSAPISPVSVELWVLDKKPTIISGPWTFHLFVLVVVGVNWQAKGTQQELEIVGTMNQPLLNYSNNKLPAINQFTIVLQLTLNYS